METDLGTRCLMMVLLGLGTNFLILILLTVCLAFVTTVEFFLKHALRSKQPKFFKLNFLKIQRPTVVLHCSN